MRNTTLYGLGHTKTTRRNSSAIELDFVEKYYEGTNLQNIEKSMRSLYVPDDGYAFIQRDQSGAEALIVAYLCRNAKYRQLFTYNVKPHVFVALHVFSDVWEKEMNKYSQDIKLNIKDFLSLEIPDLPKHPQWKELDKLIKDSDNWPPEKRYYYISKQICHSSNYGIKPAMFALNTLIKSKGRIRVSKKEAEKYLDFYHVQLFPEIREWHSDVQKQFTETNYLYDLFGHPCYLPFSTFSQNIDSFWKEAYAQVPQKTVATITAVAVSRMYKYIIDEKKDWHLLADTHDSFMCQAPVDEAEECNTKMKEFLGIELTAPRGEKFRMKSEGAIGFNWAPYKKGVNEMGLVTVKD